MKSNIKKALSLTAAITMLSSTFVYADDIPAYCDEAFYITADYYGNLKESSVVKGYYVNGAKTIKDYGNYDSIINMTDKTEPVVNNGEVSFTFGDKSPDRFYFEGKTSEPMKNVPFLVSVDYKLNGVPKKAQELAGEDGLVEINLNIIPNKNADEYFRNNFMLMATTVVNSDDILSLEAQGAQVQSAGNIKAVMFAAMPGEEQHFQLRIGTEDFSFAGWTFLMMPATVEQLKEINDLRELKEKTEDSATAISDSLDVILNTMDSLSSSCSSISDGLNTLDDARQIISDGKGNVYSDADNSLENLKKLSEGLEPFDEHLEKASSTLDELNKELNSTYNYVNKISTGLEDLEGNMTEISSDLDALDKWIKEENKNIDDYHDILKRLKDNLNRLTKNVSDTSMYLYNLHGSLDDLEFFADRISMTYLTGDLSGYINMFQSSDPGAAVTLGALSEMQAYLNNMSSMVDVMAPRISSVASTSSDLCKSLSLAADNGNSLIDSLADLTKLLDNSLSNYEEHQEDITSLIEDSKNTIDTLNGISSDCRNVISGGNDIKETVNENHEGLLKSIEDSQTLLNTTIEGTNSLYEFCTDLENLVKESGNKLDEGTAKTLASLTDALAKTADGLSQTGVIKDAKDTVKDLIESEWDEHTGENSNILLMDAEAQKLSLTSSQNPEPSSLQILMRTEEISVDDEDTSKDVDEDFHAEGNVFTRIASIFKKIFDMIGSIFN